MTHVESENPGSAEQAADGTAYLLTWDGATWRDAVRLRQGQVTTIGRSTNNRVVLQDDSCSRNHCELFFGEGEWRLRDLGSRNGTLIHDRRVTGDQPLVSGDIIGIGVCRLGFTTNLGQVLPTPQKPHDSPERATSATQTSVPVVEPVPSILHSARLPEFLATGQIRRERSAELARLYRLGLEMGVAETQQQLTDVVLASLTRETVAGISAILLSSTKSSARPAPADLVLSGWHSVRDLPYMKALSVICAPIQTEERVFGLIHLYSSNPDNPLDRNDLEFTLAVAGQLALALHHLQQRDSLQTGLAKARSANEVLRSQLSQERLLVGETSQMRDLREKLDLIAETDANVLIRGESGCGKELIARSIHERSPRRDGPFVCINCAALKKVNCSDTKREHSRARLIENPVDLNRRTAGHCFWMKLEK